MNKLPSKMQTGTIAELLVQLRLIEHGVEAARPLTDTGNDLVAIKGEVFRALQVKSTVTASYDRPSDERKFHILAVVFLKWKGGEFSAIEAPSF